MDGTRFVVELLQEIASKPPVLLVRVGHRVISVSAHELADEGEYAIEINGRRISARLEEAPLESSTESKTVQGPVLVKSPMAGKIAAVKTSLGATVEEGQALIMLEAMKMENEIAAPKRGTVKEIYVKAGALAKLGEKLVLIE